jgi:hypothetical protein
MEKRASPEKEDALCFFGVKFFRDAGSKKLSGGIVSLNFSQRLNTDFFSMKRS